MYFTDCWVPPVAYTYRKTSKNKIRDWSGNRQIWTHEAYDSCEMSLRRHKISDRTNGLYSATKRSFSKAMCTQTFFLRGMLGSIIMRQASRKAHRNQTLIDYQSGPGHVNPNHCLSYWLLYLSQILRDRYPSSPRYNHLAARRPGIAHGSRTIGKPTRRKA